MARAFSFCASYSHPIRLIHNRPIRSICGKRRGGIERTSLHGCGFEHGYRAIRLLLRYGQTEKRLPGPRSFVWNGGAVFRQFGSGLVRVPVVYLGGDGAVFVLARRKRRLVRLRNEESDSGRGSEKRARCDQDR